MQTTPNHRHEKTFPHAQHFGPKKWLWGAILFCTLANALLAAPRKFSDRLMFDLGAQALIPQNQPTGLGGGLGFGYEFRDFNLFLRGSGMIAEPGQDSRNLITAVLRPELRIGVSPSLLILLPYIDIGIINGKVRRPNNRGESSNITTPYAATGLGMEILLSHELSFISRFGIAHAFMVAGNDSNNFSGPTLELSLRYTVGRNAMLDY